MPTFADLLSQKLNNAADPGDQLRLMIGQDQGANLQGGPDGQPDAQTPPSQGGIGPAGPGAPPGMPAPQAVPPSPNVAGPLAALAKPRVKLKTPIPFGAKPKIRLKTPIGKPKIKLKAGGMGGV